MSEKNLTNEITIYDKIQDPIQAIEKLGEWISKSGLFGCEKVEQGMVLAMTSLAERRPVTEICRRYHIVKGKLSMKAEAMLADFNQRGGRHKWIKSDDKEAVIALTYMDFNNFEVKYTIGDAEKANLCGKDGVKTSEQTKNGSWQKNPDAMLRARVTSKAIRMVCPEIVAGIYTPEEIDDMRPVIETTATILPPLLSITNKNAATTVTDEPKKETTNGTAEAPSGIQSK